MDHIASVGALPVNRPDSAAVVDGLCTRLIAHYVFPAVGEAMAAALREHATSGAYDTMDKPTALALRLTNDMRAVSGDKHLAVMWHANEQASQDESAADDTIEDAWLAQGLPTNFGFHRVERLPGNIGYLDLRLFFPAEQAGDVVVSAMTFLAHTYALIVDVRKNGGGDPSGISLLSSYLFPPEPVHLNDLYWRSDDSIHQWWTLSWVPGSRYLDKPVYVLTSSYTFSGAEEFAYNLQALKRVTIIGETTGGGANPGTVHRLHDGFAVFIPDGRAINPITGTNWEGVGVVPDIGVAESDALQVAHRHALEFVTARAREDSTRYYAETVREAQAALEGSVAIRGGALFGDQE